MVGLLLNEIKPFHEIRVKGKRQVEWESFVHKIEVLPVMIDN